VADEQRRATLAAAPALTIAEVLATLHYKDQRTASTTGKASSVRDFRPEGRRGADRRQ